MPLNSEEYDVAFNEINAVKYKKRLHEDWEMPLSEMKKTWKEILADIKPFMRWINEHKVPFYPTDLCCYVATSSDSQLGKVCFLPSS